MKLTGCIAILQKELLHMARDPATLIFSMLPPIVQVIAFGFAIDTDVRDLATVIYNQDGKEQSRNFIQALVNSDVYKVRSYVFSHEELIRVLVEGRAVVGVEIPPDFTDRYKAGKSASAAVYLDGSNNMIALQAMATANGIGLQSMIEQLGRLTGQANPVPLLDVRPRVLFNPDLLSANFFVPGIIGVAIQLSLTMLVSFAIVREREIGTLEQLLVSPATRFALLLGKLIPYVGLAYIQIGLLILAMRLFFGIPVHGSVVLLLALAGVFALAVIGIGLIISTTAKNQVQATQLAIATLLPSIFLSGFIYPRDTMPLFFYTISYFLPLTYFLDILRGIVLRGAEFPNLVSAVVPLSCMAVTLFSLSVIKFRKRLD